ncbi:MAG: hypothetical protein Fur0022_21410 [Anaerolineales bacterium]
MRFVKNNAIWLILLPFILTACTSASPLEEAERKWQAQGIGSYQIEVLVVRSIWHAQYQQLTVENGMITFQTARCVPAPFEGQTCEVEPFTAEDYTVPGLFAKASAESEKEDTTSLNITYEPTYGYPAKIVFDDPEIFDEDWSWAVTSFEVLAP